MSSSACILSIVTVTMNCADTIERTLKSVQEIKDADIEYIVIDGASGDGTLEVVEGYRSVVDVLISEPDRGIYHAMNKGASLATGQYILFINGDDYIVRDNFPIIIDALKRSVSDIVCASTLVGSFAAPTEVLKAQPYKLIFFNSVPHPSTFVKASVMRSCPFQEGLRIAADYDFFLRSFMNKRRFEVLPYITAVHQRGGASGDEELSRKEVEFVRRQRLGRLYLVALTLERFFRVLKAITNEKN